MVSERLSEGAVAIQEWPPNLMDLLGFLRDSDFHVGTDAVLRSHALMERLHISERTPKDPDELSRWLAPILCSNPRDQDRLPASIGAYMRRIGTKSPSPPVQHHKEDGSADRAVPATPFNGFGSRVRAILAVVAISLVSIISQAASVAVRLIAKWRNRYPALSRHLDDGRSVAALKPAGNRLRLFDRMDILSRVRDAEPMQAAARLAAGQVGRATLDMSSRIQMRGRRPDIRASIRATIAKGGRPVLAPGWYRRSPAYPILIETRSSRDHVATVGRAIADSLETGDVYHTRYLFNADPRLVRTESSNPISLSIAQVAARFDSDVLTIVSDGECFLDPLSGQLEPWISEFDRWRSVVLLTPVPQRRWSWRERRLSLAGLIVLPTTPQGLLRMAEFVRFRGPPPRPAFENRPAVPSVLGQEIGRALRWHTQNVPDDEEREAIVDAVRLELPPNAFELICVLGLFPELRPDFTLYMARMLRQAAGGPIVDESGFATLAALPWFRAGRMPDWLRLELGVLVLPERRAEAKALYSRWLLGDEAAVDDPDPMVIARAERRLAASRRVIAYSEARDQIFLTFFEGKELSDLDVEVSGEVVDRLRRAPADEPDAYPGLQTVSRPIDWDLIHRQYNDFYNIHHFKDMLNDAEFAVFMQLRALRKERADAEGVPAYAILTNEQLAEMVQKRVTSATALREILGIGEARVEKYGPSFLPILQAAALPDIAPAGQET